MGRAGFSLVIIVFVFLPALAVEPPAPPLRDVYKYAGLPPQEAAGAMTVPDGFSVGLFAGEPDVHQPIAMCLDERGRVLLVKQLAGPYACVGGVEEFTERWIVHRACRCAANENGGPRAVGQ